MPTSAAPTPERAHLYSQNRSGNSNSNHSSKKQLKLRRLFPDHASSASRRSDQRSLFADECVQDDLTRPMDTRALPKAAPAIATGQFANFEAAAASSCIAGMGTGEESRGSNSTNNTSSKNRKQTSSSSSSSRTTTLQTPPRHPPNNSNSNDISSGGLLQPSARDSRKKRRPFGTPLRKQSEHDPPGTNAATATATASVVTTSPPSGSSRKPIVVGDQHQMQKTAATAQQQQPQPRKLSPPFQPQLPFPQNNKQSIDGQTISDPPAGSKNNNNNNNGSLISDVYSNAYKYDDNDDIFDDVDTDTPTSHVAKHNNNNTGNHNQLLTASRSASSDHESAYGDDDSTAVAGTTSMPSTVQHLSPLSSSLVLDPPRPSSQQQQQQSSHPSILVRKPRPTHPPPSPGDASSTLSDLTPSHAPSVPESRSSHRQQQKQQQRSPRETASTTVFVKPRPQRPAAPPPLAPRHSNMTSAAAAALTKSQLTSSNQSNTSKSNSQHRPPSPLLKAALARPFERTPARHSWVVEVSSAEWDADEKRWKYRILVQKRPASTTTTATVKPSTKDGTTATATDAPFAASSSFTTAFTWRSVADFFWLEAALQKEFQGALLLPLLSVALGRTSATASEMPVESEKLKHWLSDVLNGVRGAGEWNLPIQNNQQEQQRQQLPSSLSNEIQQKMPQVDLMGCESVETFLYRNTVGTTLEDDETKAAAAAAAQRATPAFQCGTTAQRLRCTDVVPSIARRGRKNDFDGEEEETVDQAEAQCSGAPPSSVLQSLMESVLAAPLEMCTGPQQGHLSSRRGRSESPTGRRQQQQQMLRSANTKSKLPLEVLNYSSEALGSAKDFNMDDSFLDPDASSVLESLRESGEIAIHTELLEAEKQLSLNYRKTALRALEKLHTLHDEEEKLGAAWKRFAVCLSNLFAHEKDVEHASLGEKIKKDQMPYRKVDKKAVDDCLRDLARHKTERSTPGLVTLSAMLHAYVSDLSSVQPAVDFYAKCLSNYVLAVTDKPSSSVATTSSVSSSTTSRDPLQAANKSWSELKEWTLHSLNRATGAARTGDVQPNASDESSAPELIRQQLLLKQEEDRSRLLGNETLLRISLTTMFRTTPFRVSRMAWRYWHTEASQCALLNSAAAALRSELEDGVSKSSVSKMLKRHTKDEKADCAAELDLIQRIVNLGKWKKYAGSSESQTDGSVTTASIENELIEVDNEELNEDRSMAILRDEALDIARQRIGRWDAALATAVLKAVGVSDPNVRVEETTKDLRLVRKYAIGLRENVDRCVDAVRLLRQAFAGKSNKTTSTNSSPLPFPNESDSNQQQQSQLRKCRNEFLEDVCALFSATFVGVEHNKGKCFTASKALLKNAGINTSDPYGWIPAAAAATQKNRRSTLLSQGRVGDLAVRYFYARDAQVEWLLGSLEGLLNEYYQRVEAIESFVFMESLGILLEKHFSAKRGKALSAFEKKTDLTAAINVATRKRMKNLLVELQEKMDRLGPDVSHTTVKETKDAHLESKTLKNDLHELAVRRLTRARESSTERAITILSLWAKEEEIQAAEELKAVGEAMATLERLVCTEDFEG